MLEAGLEPARLAAGDFKSPVATNYTTRAYSLYVNTIIRELRYNTVSAGPARTSPAFVIIVITYLLIRRRRPLALWSAAVPD